MKFSVLTPWLNSQLSEITFAHALSIALSFRSQINILRLPFDDGHVQSRGNFPSVRKRLEQWGYLKEGSSRKSVFEQLGVGVQKVDAPRMNPLAAMMYHLEDNPPDLIVLGPICKDSLPTTNDNGVEIQLIRNSQVDSLIIPEKSNGFVSLADGTVSLRHILVPIDNHPNPETAIRDAAALAYIMGNHLLDMTLLFVGDRPELSEIKLPDQMQCNINKLVRKGHTANDIKALALDLNVDLIAMALGNNSANFDINQENMAWQVLQQAPCPILTSFTDSSVTL